MKYLSSHWSVKQKRMCTVQTVGSRLFARCFQLFYETEIRTPKKPECELHSNPLIPPHPHSLPPFQKTTTHNAHTLTRISCPQCCSSVPVDGCVLRRWRVSGFPLPPGNLHIAQKTISCLKPQPFLYGNTPPDHLTLRTTAILVWKLVFHLTFSAKSSP